MKKYNIEKSLGMVFMWLFTISCTYNDRISEDWLITIIAVTFIITFSIIEKDDS